MKITDKALAAITDPDAGDAAYGGFEAILSAPTVDRDGDLFATGEWKTPLPDRIVIDVDHEMSVAGTVGSAVPYFDDDGNLCVRGTFASTARAQEVRTLIREGHITTMSVACMTDRELKKAGSPCRELLNGAFVAIPSNREALITSVKAGARNSAADAKSIQAIHDAASSLGANCAEPDTDSGSGASDGANKTVTIDVEANIAKMTRDMVVVSSKAVVGSLEDLRDRIGTALSQIYNELDNGYTWIRATFLDDDGQSGTVVYDLDGSDNGDVTLAREFTDDGETVTLADELAQVALITDVRLAGPVVNTTIDPDQDGDDDSANPAEGIGQIRSAMTREDFRAELESILKTTADTGGEPHSEAAVKAAGEAATADEAVAAEVAAGEAAESDVAVESRGKAMRMVTALLASEIDSDSM